MFLSSVSEITEMKDQITIKISYLVILNCRVESSSNKNKSNHHFETDVKYLFEKWQQKNLILKPDRLTRMNSSMVFYLINQNTKFGWTN